MAEINEILAAIDSSKKVRSAVIERLVSTHAQEVVNPLRAIAGDDVSWSSITSNKDWSE
ncbi:hypothetical protein [Streptacidiphilus pinicola]|uniref:hypothetical protein n=1 Tax=Streptacidiphilus pinicola TaxID=2219663 RepID=UPI00140233A3|nr:hypothetical protein [Streptacidiphilus pinicola]